MSFKNHFKRYRTLVLGLVALFVFVYGAITVFGVDPWVMAEIAGACVALVVVMAVLGLLVGWVWQKLRGKG
ncbi:MAG TPA: hypothetical protein VIM96_01455 [Pseudomonadales bacterium]